jgi:hypothetical protein
MIYTEFDWNWPTGSEEDFFFQYKHMLINIIMVFLLWPFLTPRDNDVNNSESTLYQKSFM